MGEVNGYYLTKVTDKQWAECLLDGELYLRSLTHFGDLLHRPRDSNNSYRGDPLEGAVAATGSSSSFVKDALGDGFPAKGHVVWLSESVRQRHIYSLFCLLYSTASSTFFPPDSRLHQFGDTAVIIVRPIEFFARFRRCLSERSIDLGVCAAKRVKYYLDSSTAGAYEEFSKSATYSWQNEYRLSVDVSMGQADLLMWSNMSDLDKIQYMREGREVNLSSFGIDLADADADVSHEEWAAMSIPGKILFLNERCPDDAAIEREPLVREPLVLQLGDLRDVCVSISTSELVALKLPFDEGEHTPYVLPPLNRLG